jgi:hypothetical protein
MPLILVCIGRRGGAEPLAEGGSGVLVVPCGTGVSIMALLSEGAGSSDLADSLRAGLAQASAAVSPALLSMLHGNFKLAIIF